MTKPEILDLLMLLSAMESWSFSVKSPFPDYLLDRISESIVLLTSEVLNNEKQQQK
jgi:hypothetical protein